MKLELNVKRFNNEDVIATSAVVCNHLTSKHIYVTSYAPDPAVPDPDVFCVYNVYHYANGKLVQDSYGNHSTAAGINAVSAGWYWFDGSNYHLCDDQSEEVHPSQSN